MPSWPVSVATGACSGDVPTAPTAASSSPRTVTWSASRSSPASATRSSGWRTRWSPRAVDAPRTASSRSRLGPVPRSISHSRSCSWLPEQTSSSRVRARTASSGEAARPSTSSRGDRSSTTPTAAHTGAPVSRSAARAGSPKPSRTRLPRRVRAGRPPDPGAVVTASSGGRCSQHRQVPHELERGHLSAVGVPLLALVAQHEVEHVLAEGLGHKLGRLHDRDRLLEGGGQRLDAEGPALAVGQLPDVVLRAVGQLVALFDALEAGCEHDGEGEVGVRGGVHRPVLDAGRVSLAR